MQDPYQTLGVRRGASKPEIKAAYKEMVKKYHPDRHANLSPEMEELAKRKMQEINEAYDVLMKDGGGGYGSGDQASRYGPGSSRGYGGGAGYYNASNYGDAYGGAYDSGAGQSSGFNPAYQDIRRKIDMGDIAGAESDLGAMGVRDAEWWFLHGMIGLRKGWYDQAVNGIQTAVQMDPGNMEYRQALNALSQRQYGYQQGGYQQGYDDATNRLCQCMSCYCCADACCSGDACC